MWNPPTEYDFGVETKYCPITGRMLTLPELRLHNLKKVSHDSWKLSLGDLYKVPECTRSPIVVQTDYADCEPRIVIAKHKKPRNENYVVNLTPGEASGRIHPEGREKETPSE